MTFSYDLHIHSCLSPCGDMEMTPRNITAMAALCGLQVIAVADHNTCAHSEVVAKAAAENGILAVPAMELTTAEEVHVLCLLPDLDTAKAFSDYVYARLPDIPNREDIFGQQCLMDDQDNPVGVESRLLLTATSISIYNVVDLLDSFGGVALPAHIDRSSFSLLSNLGLWDATMGFSAYELHETYQKEALEKRFPDLRHLHLITNSDAHMLETLSNAVDKNSDYCIISLDKLSAPSLIRALKDS